MVTSLPISFIAPSMNLGIQHIFQTEIVSKTFLENEYDFITIEIHHRFHRQKYSEIYDYCQYAVSTISSEPVLKMKNKMTKSTQNGPKINKVFLKLHIYGNIKFLVRHKYFNNSTKTFLRPYGELKL